jgi:predicted chitinase
MFAILLLVKACTQCIFFIDSQCIHVKPAASAPVTPDKQRVIANTVYGGVYGCNKLGNAGPDDNNKYRGRSPSQITRRSND